MTGFLEHRIQDRLHFFPDAIAPRFDDHTAADFRIFGEVGGFDDLLIPFREVIVACGGDSVLGLFAHD